jgi:hypothetical protein
MTNSSPQHRDPEDFCGGDWELRELGDLDARDLAYQRKFEDEAGSINIGSYVLTAVYRSIPTAKHIKGYLEGTVGSLYSSNGSFPDHEMLVNRFVRHKPDLRRGIPQSYVPTEIKEAVLSLPKQQMAVPFPEGDPTPQLVQEIVAELRVARQRDPSEVA